MVEHLDEKVAKQRSEIDRCSEAEGDLYQQVDNQVLTQHASQGGGGFKHVFFPSLFGEDSHFDYSIILYCGLKASPRSTYSTLCFVSHVWDSGIFGRLEIKLFLKTCQKLRDLARSPGTSN